VKSLPPLPSMQALRVLDAVVQHQNFSVAAQDLGLTHGAVSRQIHQLEALMGVTLFRRRMGRMEPTEAALAAISRAGYGLRIISEVFSKPPLHAPQKSLRVDAAPDIARFWLAPRSEALSGAEDFQIAAIETEPELATAASLHGDAAIRYGSGVWKGMQSEFLGAERIVAVASVEFARRRDRWDPEAIIRSPLIMNKKVSWRSFIAAAQLPADTPLKPAIEASDSALSLDLALMGVGIALARVRLVKPLIARSQLEVLSPVTFDEGHGYYFVRSADAIRKPSVAAFGGWLQREFSSEGLELASP